MDWNFICHGVGRHIFLLSDLESDISHDKKHWAFMFCPFAVKYDPKYRKANSMIIDKCGKTPRQSAKIALVGERMDNVITAGFLRGNPDATIAAIHNLEPRYSRNACSGLADLSPFIIDSLTHMLAYPDYDKAMIYNGCPYCKQYGDGRSG